MRKIDLIVIHCASTRANQDIGAKEINEWHNQRGFSGIGYHYVIRRDGTIEKGRPDSKPGAHASGYNKNSIGVCLVGGLKDVVKDKNGKIVRWIPETNFTHAQWVTLKSLVQDLVKKYPGSKVLGHRDLGAPKDCPTFSVREWLKKENVLSEEEQVVANHLISGQAKPLMNSRTVGGAVVGGAAGLAGLADNAQNVADAASSVSWLADPGNLLSIVLIALVVGGTIISILGRKKAKSYGEMGEGD